MDVVSLQKKLLSIEESISEVRLELEELKASPKTDQTIDYKRINGLGELYPLKNEYIAGLPESLKRTYLTCLSYIMLVDTKNVEERLLYLARRAKGIRFSASSEEILQMGMKVNQASIENAWMALQDHKYCFLTDVFILMNVTGIPNVEMLEMAAHFAEILKCDKDDIKIIVKVAKAVLIEQFDLLKQIDDVSLTKCSKQIRGYIAKKWIISQRIASGVVCILGDEMSFDEKYKLEVGSIVQKGQKIAEYDRKRTDAEIFREAMGQLFNNKIDILPEVTEDIFAPCNGKVFSVSCNEDNKEYVYFYIVSALDDYEEFIKWFNYYNGQKNKSS